MSRARQVLGTLGEQAAARYLEERGYEILARNYRVPGGELDLVCQRPGLLVFCEVKTRTSAIFGLPEEAVTISKQLRIRRLATEYMRREGRRARTVRFDVFSVSVADGRITDIRHIANAF